MRQMLTVLAMTAGFLLMFYVLAYMTGVSKLMSLLGHA